MPRHTEIRIEQLCEEAAVAKSERHGERVAKDLQAALSEHIVLARKSLEAQVSALSTLEAKTKDNEPEPNKKPKLRKHGK